MEAAGCTEASGSCESGWLRPGFKCSGTFATLWEGGASEGSGAAEGEARAEGMAEGEAGAGGAAEGVGLAGWVLEPSERDDESSTSTSSLSSSSLSMLGTEACTQAAAEGLMVESISCLST